MKRTAILDNILSLSRSDKEYLYDNFDQIADIIIKEESYIKTASTQDVWNTIIERGKGTNLPNLIKQYRNYPDETLIPQIQDEFDNIISDLFPEYAEGSEEDLYLTELQENYNGERIITDLTPAFNLDQGTDTPPSNTVSPVDPIGTTEDDDVVIENTNDSDYQIMDDADSRQAVFKGTFTVPLTEGGQFAIDFVGEPGKDLLADLSAIYESAKIDKNISPHALIGKTDDLAEYSVESDTENAQIVMELLEEYERAYGKYANKQYVDKIKETVQNKLENRLNVRNIRSLDPAIVSQETDQLMTEIKASADPKDQELVAKINTLEYFDNIGRDFFGNHYRWYLANYSNLGGGTFDLIMSFAEKLYGKNFSEPITNLTLSEVVKTYGTPEGLTDEDVPGLGGFVSQIRSLMGGDDLVVESELKDLFSTESLKYYGAMNNMANTYQLQRELSRGIQSDLTNWCPTCGRFRPRVENYDKHNYAAGEDVQTDTYYIVRDGRKVFNVSKNPNSAYAPEVLDTLSDEARELIGNENHECPVDEFIPNFFAPKDVVQDDPEIYYSLEEVRLNPSDPNPLMKNDGTPLKGDKKYKDFMASMYEKLLGNSANPELLASDIKDLINVSTQEAIYPDDLEDEEFAGRVQASGRVFNAIDNMILSDPQKMEKIRQEAIDAGMDEENYRKLFAFRTFYRMIPSEIPTRTYNRNFVTPTTRTNAAIDYAKVAPLAHLSNIGEFPVEQIKLISSPSFKDSWSSVVKVLRNLAMEYISENFDVPEDVDPDEFREKAINDFLKMKTIKVPLVPDQPKIKGAKNIEEARELDPEAIAEYERKKHLIETATSVEQLEKDGLVMDVDFVGYEAKAEDLASMFGALVHQYRKKLRNPDVAHIDPISGFYDDPKKAKYNNAFDLKKLEEPRKKRSGVRPMYLDMFKDAMEQARSMGYTEQSGAQVEQYYAENVGDAGFKSKFPVEDMAVAMMYETLRQQYSIPDIEAVKVALKDQLEVARQANGHKGPYKEDIYGSIGAVLGGANPNFISGITTDESLDMVKDWVIQPQPNVAPSHYVEPYKTETSGGNVEPFPAGMDTLAKFLSTDDQVASTILKTVGNRNTALEPILRQSIAALTFGKHNASPEKLSGENLMSLKEMATLLSNVFRGGIPSRDDVAERSTFARGTKNLSLSQALFPSLGIDWLGESFGSWFSPQKGYGHKKKIKQRESRNNWYRKAQTESKEDKFVAVLVFKPEDMVSAIHNMYVYSRPRPYEKTYMPKIGIVPFMKYGSLSAIKRAMKESDYNLVPLKESHLEFLKEAGLV